MDKIRIIFIVFLIFLLVGLTTATYFITRHYDTFTTLEVCSNGLSTIIRRSMNLNNGDNSLPSELIVAKCISVDDFRKLSDTGLLLKSSVLHTLFNLFQNMDSEKPYISKFIDWKIKNNNGELIDVDWSAYLDTTGSTDFQGTEKLLTYVIIPLIIKIRDIFKTIKSSTESAAKYNDINNAANRAFIDGFIAKYDSFDENSGSRLRTARTEEYNMFNVLTVKPEHRDAMVTSRPLKNMIANFAYTYLLKVDTASPDTGQCNVNIVDTPVDNDIKLYVRLKKLFDIWRGMNKTSAVAFTVDDLKSVHFANAGNDYSKPELIKYFINELRYASINAYTSGGISDAEHTLVRIVNKIVNDTFITDGSANDGRLISDPECKSDIGKLLCNIRLDNTNICIPNKDACMNSRAFNQYCTAVNAIVASAGNSSAKMPVFDLNQLPVTPSPVSNSPPNNSPPNNSPPSNSPPSNSISVSSSSSPPNNSISLSSSSSQPNNSLSLSSSSSPPNNSISLSSSSSTPTSLAITPLPQPLSASTPLQITNMPNTPNGLDVVGLSDTLLVPGVTVNLNNIGTASNAALKPMLTKHNIPAYLERSTQELLISVYEKLSASYNFDDDDVPDDIKNAIGQLPPSGKVNLCNRYCKLITRCNGICKLAGCLNCITGINNTGADSNSNTNTNAGSDVNGSVKTTLGYAEVDDDYNLLGFLDDISQGKYINGVNCDSGSGGGGSGGGGSGGGIGGGIGGGREHNGSLRKPIGPVINQKDTSGISNIFAPYIIMAPKKEGSSYGAYLLDDPNDANYRQYINDLINSY